MSVLSCRPEPNCARLITTRNRDALPPKAKPLDVDAMQVSEAVGLLSFGLPDGEDAIFAKLAQRLGEWPLLLKLVNSALHKRLAAGQPLAAALAWVNAVLDSRGLAVFDARNPAERGDAVAKTLGVSLELSLTTRERASPSSRSSPRTWTCRSRSSRRSGRARPDSTSLRPSFCARGSMTSRCS